MAAGKLDLYIEQGSTFFRKLKFTDNQPTPVEIDLTGYTYAGKIRKTIGDGTVLANFTCTVLNQLTNPGEMTVELTAAQTAALPLKAQKTATRVTEAFAYDVEVTYPSGVVERVLEGVCNVSPEVTRP